MFYSYCQLEKAKKKEAAFIVTFAKREQEIAELKVSLSVCLTTDPPSHNIVFIRKQCIIILEEKIGRK